MPNWGFGIGIFADTITVRICIGTVSIRGGFKFNGCPHEREDMHTKKDLVKMVADIPPAKQYWGLTKVKERLGPESPLSL